MRSKALLAAAAGVAGLEAFNRYVTMPREQLETQLLVTPRMWQWRFGNIAVYEAGDSANPPLLLLHGHNAAASAAEMRKPFQQLSDRFHIFAPDLLGYGLSDRPDIDYTPQLYIEFIQDILKEVVQSPATVIASSLTCAYAIEAAIIDPEWITNLILICPTGVRNLAAQPATGKAIGALLALPVVGRGLYNGIASHPSISYFLKDKTYYDADKVTDEVIRQNYRTAHVPGAQYAPSAFVSGKLYWDAQDAWTRVEQPVLIIWGKEAKLTPDSDAAAFLATNPAAELREISESGILPHDEQPEQFVIAVTEWLSRQG